MNTLLLKRAYKYLAIAGVLLLAACQQGALTLPDLSTGVSNRPAVNPPPIIQKPTLSAKVKGEKVGNGPTRIALLVPKSAQGGAGRVGVEVANAARLAIRDFGAGTLQLVIKDTKGQAAQASIAAAQARDEGASLVLGPLFSANVSAASGVTLPAKLPMIAFSSDVARARANVYLLSFAPDADIRRTLNYGLSLGGNKVVALLPNNAYGQLVERELRRTYDRAGGQVVSVVRYARDTNAMITAARSVALSLSSANAIYIPDGGQAPTLMLNSLTKAGVNLTGKQIMGSGQWESVDKSQRVLAGAIYAGADKRNFDTFSRRYRSTYGRSPTVTAGIGYDAVSLAAELIRRNAQVPFTASAIESRSGFNGATGVFRFRSNGRLQRGLVVNKIEGGRAVIVSPAPTGFGRSG